MYVWLNPNRRDRRSRKFEQVVPCLSQENVAARKKAAEELEQQEEETRRMLEIREMTSAVDEIKPIIEEFLKTDQGKEEIRAVVSEMRRIKEETARLKLLQRGLDQDKDDNMSLDSESRQSTTHELERKEKVRAIFEVFDADGSGSMDADELKELLKELCLPTSEEEVDRMMVEMDDDESGEIDFEEFYSW
jgi:Ca2+-binding EF-hand superfamily protein